MAGTLITRVATQVSAKSGDLIKQDGLLKKWTAPNERLNDMLDELEAICPLVVVAWVIFIYSIAEG